MDKQAREHMDAEEERRLTASQQQAVMSTAADQQRRKLENGYFLNELRDSDIDSEVFSWVEEEYPTWFSGAHSVTNRSDTWDDEADLMMMNKRERAFSERNPGRLLRDRPFLLAISQGVHDDPGNAMDPMSSDQRRAAYGAAEVAADLMALSKNAAGLDATTTATTETRVRRQENEDSTASKVGKVFE